MPARSSDGTDVADAWLSDLERRIARATVAARLFGGPVQPPRLGAYSVERRVGIGGSGVVFEGRHVDSAQRVALKVLRRWNPRAIARLKREFRALSDIHHDNLVQLHELSLGDEAPFLAMELIEGTSLTRFVHRDSDGAVTRLLSAAAQLVDALSCLHAAGMLHRDLKPSNLLVQADGRLVVLDFGLAQMHGEPGSPRSSGESGTQRYMAPERFRGAASGPDADWFSAGVILIELLPSVLECGAVGDPQLSRFTSLCRRMVALKADERPRAAELRSFFGLRALALEPLRPRRSTLPNEPLVFEGRSTELSQLRAAFARASAGECVIAHLSGPPGIGKTTLVDHYVRELQVEPGMAIVLAGRCHERELMRYNVLDGVIEQLAGTLSLAAWSTPPTLTRAGKAELTRLFPVLATVLDGRGGPAAPSSQRGDAAHARTLAFEALGQVLQSLTAQRPLVLILDDLQWGDADSARALEWLLSGETLRGVLVIGCYRSADAPHSPTVAALAQIAAKASHDELRIELGPLSASASLRVATALSRGALSFDMLASLSAQAAGSPLFLRMLIQHGAVLGQHEALHNVTLPRLLLLAIEQLPEECRAVLQLAALCARPIAARLLLCAARAHLAGDVRNDHVVRLQRSGWLRSVRLPVPHTEGLCCFHDRLRETLSETLAGDVKRRAHAALADAAAQLGHSDHEFLATHHHEAGRLQNAALHFEQAGDRAVAGLAMEHAAALYTRALECKSGIRPAALVEKLADALAGSGRCGAAVELFLEAAEKGSGLAQLRLRLNAASMLLRAGPSADSSQLLGPLLRSLGVRFHRSRRSALASAAVTALRIHVRGVNTDAPRREATEIERLRIEYCLEIGDRLSISDPMRACLLLLRGLLLALEHGTDAQLARSIAAYAMILASADMWPAATQDALLQRAMSIAQRSGSGARSWVKYYGGLVRLSRCDIRGFHDEFDASRRFALLEPPRDMSWRSVEYEIASCISLAYLGDLRSLDGRLEPLLRRVQECNNPWQVGVLATTRAILLLARDEPAAADQVIDHGLRAGPSDRTGQTGVMGLLTKVAIALYRKEPLPARRLLQQFMRLQGRGALWHDHLSALMFAQAEGQLALACLASDPGGNLRAAKSAIAKLDRQRNALAQCAADGLRAALAQLARRDMEAAQLFARIAERAAEIGSLDIAAGARLRRAQLLRVPMPHEAARYYEEHGVRDPARFVRIVFPIDPATEA